MNNALRIRLRYDQTTNKNDYMFFGTFRIDDNKCYFEESLPKFPEYMQKEFLENCSNGIDAFIEPYIKDESNKLYIPKMIITSDSFRDNEMCCEFSKIYKVLKYNRLKIDPKFSMFDWNAIDEYYTKIKFHNRSIAINYEMSEIEKVSNIIVKDMLLEVNKYYENFVINFVQSTLDINGRMILANEWTDITTKFTLRFDNGAEIHSRAQFKIEGNMFHCIPEPDSEYKDAYFQKLNSLISENKNSEISSRFHVKSEYFYFPDIKLTIDGYMLSFEFENKYRVFDYHSLKTESDLSMFDWNAIDEYYISRNFYNEHKGIILNSVQIEKVPDPIVKDMLLAVHNKCGDFIINFSITPRLERKF